MAISIRKIVTFFKNLVNYEHAKVNITPTSCSGHFWGLEKTLTKAESIFRFFK